MEVADVPEDLDSAAELRELSPTLEEIILSSELHTYANEEELWQELQHFIRKIYSETYNATGSQSDEILNIPFERVHWLVHALCILNADYLFRVLEKEAYRYLKFLQHQLLESMSCLPDNVESKAVSSVFLKLILITFENLMCTNDIFNGVLTLLHNCYLFRFKFSFADLNKGLFLELIWNNDETRDRSSNKSIKSYVDRSKSLIFAQRTQSEAINSCEDLTQADQNFLELGQQFLNFEAVLEDFKVTWPVLKQRVVTYHLIHPDDLQLIVQDIRTQLQTTAEHVQYSDEHVIDSDEDGEFTESISAEIADQTTCQDVNESISTESDDDDAVVLSQSRVRRNNPHDVNALRSKLRNKYRAKKQAETEQHVTGTLSEHGDSNDSRSIDELVKFINTEEKKKKRKKPKKGNPSTVAQPRDTLPAQTEHVTPTAANIDHVPVKSLAQLNGLGAYPRFWEEDHEPRDPEIDKLVEEFRQRLADHQPKIESQELAKMKIEPHAFERLADICRNSSKNRFQSPGERTAPASQGTHRSKRKKKK
jgi:hypothetical protein